MGRYEKRGKRWSSCGDNLMFLTTMTLFGNPAHAVSKDNPDDRHHPMITPQHHFGSPLHLSPLQRHHLCQDPCRDQNHVHRWCDDTLVCCCIRWTGNIVWISGEHCLDFCCIRWTGNIVWISGEHQSLRQTTSLPHRTWPDLDIYWYTYIYKYWWHIHTYILY